MLLHLLHGEESYVNGDMKLDSAKFQPPAPANAPAQSLPAGSLSVKLQLESDPSRADIDVDGSLVGNTPSEVQVTDGDHIVSVKKKGFKDLERTLKASSGSNIHLSAELEKAENP